jgi:NAD(P)-dependent dehydrogenase (short-subunit alcohol dehydrogenase family)
MRAQRSGLVVTTSSTAGIAGLEFSSAYAASKFAIEGWIESITPELSPFGIRTRVATPPSSPARSSTSLARDEPPLRWAAGADAVEILERKAQTMLAQANAYRELSSSLAHDDATT